jgi:hypothetical protein
MTPLHQRFDTGWIKQGKDAERYPPPPASKWQGIEDYT